jgi:catechol 2,3-dioxygenase-like lactoylglutathione lyase family enzyme
VDDLEEARIFYEDILGFGLVLDQGGCRIVKTSPESGGYLGYCLRPERTGGKSNLILTLVTEQVDEWYSYLKDQNVTLEDPPRTNLDYGIYHFFFQDPAGYLWEIQRFLEENWDQPMG